MDYQKHFVIALYFAEICVFCVYAVLYAVARRQGAGKTPFVFCVIMFIRLIVKLVYFYVEFYVAGWALNVFINLAMDSTYVVSMFWLLRLISEYSDIPFRRKTLQKIAAFFFVFGFFMISLLAVDRLSNHLIIINGEVPTFFYTLNEIFYLTVAISSIVPFFLGALRQKEKRVKAVTLTASTLFAAYTVWVFLWNVSFVFLSVEPIRHVKPFDGVLFFALAMMVLMPFLAKTGFSEKDGLPQAISPDENDSAVAAFSTAYSLTAREHEVLALTYRGMSSSEVANTLYITLNTVKRHLYNIYKKCAVGNKYELIYKINHFVPQTGGNTPI